MKFTPLSIHQSKTLQKMTAFATRLLFFGCILMLFPATILAQLKKEATKQTANLPAKVVLKTSRGLTFTGSVASVNGDTLTVKDKNGGITFFSMKTLQLVKFYDADGKLVDYPPKVASKEPSNSVVIETQTGDVIKGKLLARRGDTVEIDIGIGKPITLLMGQIKSLVRANEVSTTNKSSIVDYQAPYENPFAARGMLTLNGMQLKKGQSYYQNVYGIFFHNFGLHLSDYVNLQIGTTTIPVVGFINPNLTVPIGEYITVGGGVAFWITPESFTTSLFGSLAIGTRDNNIGLKVGKHLGNEGLFDNFSGSQALPFTIAAQARVGNNWSLVGELLAFSPQNDLNILAIGARYMRPRLALDFGLGGAGEIAKRSNCPTCRKDFFFGLPYITVSLIIGKRKK
jgi:hypothetical protein